MIILLPTFPPHGTQGNALRAMHAPRLPPALSPTEKLGNPYSNQPFTNGRGMSWSRERGIGRAGIARTNPVVNPVL